MVTWLADRDLQTGVMDSSANIDCGPVEKQWSAIDYGPVSGEAVVRTRSESQYVPWQALLLHHTVFQPIQYCNTTYHLSEEKLKVQNHISLCMCVKNSPLNESHHEAIESNSRILGS